MRQRISPSLSPQNSTSFVQVWQAAIKVNKILKYNTLKNMPKKKLIQVFEIILI